MATWTLVEGTLLDGLPMRLFIAELDGRISSACMHDDQHPRSDDEFVWRLGKTAKWQRLGSASLPEPLKAASEQVTEYFAGNRQRFELPFAFNGTPFQVQVWSQLARIPFGTTCSYGDLAAAIDHPKAVRAVGGANGRNRLPLFIPCHRVVAFDGKLGGFTGGLGLKRRLLAHEAAVLARRNAA